MLQSAKWLPLGAALACTILVGACRREVGRQPENESEAAAKPSQAPVVHGDKLDREGVILAVLRATTAAALGRNDRDEQRALDGRQFKVRIRFGCPGIRDPDRGWSYDGKKQVLRVTVRSNLTEEALPPSDLLRSSYEGGVGFALGRPLLLSAGCPTGGFASATAAEPTIIIAQLFTAADSRVQRPEREYALTRPLKAGQQPKQGLDLILSGRLARLSDGRPIHCAAQDGPPACIVNATMDRVAIEDPLSGEILGEWGTSAGAQ